MTIQDIKEDERVMYLEKDYAEGMWFLQLEEGWVADDMTSSIYQKTIAAVSRELKKVKPGEPV